jgi:uncharacterized protein (TIGR00369 family)
MSAFPTRNPRFEEDTRASFARQSFMATLGAEMVRVAPGEVDLAMPFSPAHCQQHGFLHAGAITSLADSANGYAALTLCEPGVDVLAVEFKINLVSPATAPRFIAEGRVLRPGRTLTACLSQVYGLENDRRILVATMLSTIISKPALLPS